jgi:hypothetical protein
MSVAAFLFVFSNPALSQQALELRPNIRPLPASDVMVVISTDGTPELRFSATSWNNGIGPLELIAGETTASTRVVHQRVYRNNGTYYDQQVGSFVYHPEHNHTHLEGYALYTLRPVNGGSAKVSEKTSFCIMDTTKVDGSLPGAPLNAVYVTCDPNVQGMSVGWGDRYSYILEGQSISLAGSPDGDYDLIIDYDPRKRIVETNDGDNSVCARLRISVTNRTVQTLGQCGTSPTVTVTGIAPNSGWRGGVFDVTITGSGFTSGIAVGFENGSGPAPTANNIVVVNSSTITARVTIKNGGSSRDPVWDLRVGSGVLPNAFTVTP